MSLRTRLASGLLFLLASACATPGGAGPAGAAPPPPLRWGQADRAQRLAAAADELEPAIRAAAEKARVPGLAIGLVAGGELVWFRGLGVREVSTGAPVDADTAFRIASMSKAFVSAAVLQLRDEGRLSLDDPAERYLPELKGVKGATADAPPFTIRQLLSHAAGLPEDNATADLRMPMPEADFSRLLAQGLSFSTAPGTRFEYSNLGFALAGRILARVTGQRFQEVIASRLLRPLAMGDTRWEGSEVPEGRKAHGYGRGGSAMPSPGLEKYQDDAPHEEPELADGAWAAIGGLWTTPRDYARWVAFQLSAWPPRDEPERGPVRRASLREAQTLQRPSSWRAERDDRGELEVSVGGYGLGWGVRSSCAFPRLVSHTGGLPGYGSLVLLLPDQDLGVFTMANLTYTNAGAAALALLEGLRARGLLPARPTPTSPQLEQARAGVLGLLQAFDPERAVALLDTAHGAYEPLPAFQARLAAFAEAMGPCRAAPGDEPEDALRGTLHLACQRGEADLLVELTSDLPPRLQTLVLRPALPPAPPLRQLAEAVAVVTGAREEAGADRLLAPGVAAEPVRRELRRLWANQGACGQPVPRWGDGKAAGTFRLRCERGEAELELAVDGATGRASRIHLTAAAGTVRCPR